ncbi:succinate dehydrogenase subunit C [Sphingomonas sp. MM-1]|nr:succinate dehydrogenase subunit C [Sphingomonas sp. MM-1]OHT21069.1 Succinate dehydrogenase/Fumarate reductase transmembrane subunit [Sphingomonas haloaromaticamans]
MLVSILHRATGTALAIGGGILFAWWLAAAASGPDYYESFRYYAVQAEAGDTLGCIVNVLARIVAIGLTWSFFQHLFSGLRHFVLDTGAGYELKTNRMWSILTIVGSITFTALIWGCILLARG